MKICLIICVILIGITPGSAQTNKLSIAQIPLLSLPYIDSIGPNESLDALSLERDTWTNWNLDKLEAYNSDFRYSILGKVETTQISLLLIERNYPEEMIHWVCLLDKEGKLIDWIQTAYDNSEGFLSKKSTIEQDQIIIQEWNEFEEVKQKKTNIQLTAQGFDKQ